MRNVPLKDKKGASTGENKWRVYVIESLHILLLALLHKATVHRWITLTKGQLVRSFILLLGYVISKQSSIQVNNAILLEMGNL